MIASRYNEAQSCVWQQNVLSKRMYSTLHCNINAEDLSAQWWDKSLEVEELTASAGLAKCNTPSSISPRYKLSSRTGVKTKLAKQNKLLVHQLSFASIAPRLPTGAWVVLKKQNGGPAVLEHCAEEDFFLIYLVSQVCRQRACWWRTFFARSQGHFDACCKCCRDLTRSSPFAAVSLE